MSTFDRLAKRLEKDLGYKVTRLRRTYAGSNMKASGAWVWCGRATHPNEDHSIEIGSGYTASEILKWDRPCVSTPDHWNGYRGIDVC